MMTETREELLDRRALLAEMATMVSPSWMARAENCSDQELRQQLAMMRAQATHYEDAGFQDQSRD